MPTTKAPTMETNLYNKDMHDSHDTATFTKVLMDLSNSKKHKDNNPRSLRLAAVTAAVLEMVKDDEQDAIVAAQVYGHVLTTVEGTLQQQREQYSTLVALLDLMSTTIPHVSTSSLLTTLAWSSRMLRAIVEIMMKAQQQETSSQKNPQDMGSNAVLRASCQTTARLLMRLSTSNDVGQQQEKQIGQLFQQTLLVLLHDVKPKVRKQAQDSILQIMREHTTKTNKAYRVVIKRLTQYMDATLDDKVSKQEEDDSKILHDLNFLNQIIFFLNVAKFGTKVMQTLLTVMEEKSNQTQVSTTFVETNPKHNKHEQHRIHVMNGLLTILLTLVSDEGERHKDTAKFASRVLASLLQTSPQAMLEKHDDNNNVELMDLLESYKVLYGRVLLTSCTRLLLQQQQQEEVSLVGYKLFPLALSHILLLSRDDVSTANVLMVELTQVLRTTILCQDSSSSQSSSPTLELQAQQCLETTISNMHRSVFAHSYRSTWSVTLPPLGIMVQHYARNSNQQHDVLAQEVVTSLLELRTSVATQSGSQLAVDETLKIVVSGIGMERTWPWLDWNPNKKDDKKAWILSLLRDCRYEQAQHLSFFQSTVLPLARSCDAQSVQSKQQQHYYKARVVDLWMLFPTCCQLHPPDLAQVLPCLSQTLVKALGDHVRYPQLVTTICGGIKILAAGVVERHETAFGTASNEEDFQILQQVSTKLLPALFKLVETLHGTNTKSPTATNSSENDTHVDRPPTKDKSFLISQRVQNVSEAIAALARLAPKPFLQKLFSKIMQRLLMATQSAENEKICTLLGLAQALVVSESLHYDSVSLLYRTLKPLCRSDEWEARVQKRAYKCMAEICIHYPSFVTSEDHLEGMIELLIGSIMTCQISARHMRIKCVTCIVDNLDASNPKHKALIPKVVGEVLLCLKDSNGKAREAAYQLLLSMATVRGDDEDMTEYLRIVLAALGAQTPHMRSAAVMALSRLVFEYARNDMTVQALVPSLLQTVLVLFDENSREVLKSVVGFVRVSVAAMTPQQLEPLLPDLVGGMLKYHRGKDRFRAKIKIILKKLVRLYGYEALLPLVPEGNTRLLTHMRKLDERAQRRKEREAENSNNDNKQNQDNHFDEMMESDEEDSDDGKTLMTGATGYTAMTGRSGKSLRSAAIKSTMTSGFKSAALSTGGSNRTAQAAPQLRVETEDDDVLDMLDPKMAKSVHFAPNVGEGDSDDSAGVMEFDDMGRLVVPDEHNEDSLDNDIMDVQDEEENAEIKLGGKKRRLSKCESAKVARADAQTKKSTKKQPKALGAAYKSKKAGGDVKRKDQKYEPYAYVPLDGKSYTKKNRRAAVEQMSTVVRHGKRKRN